VSDAEGGGVVAGWRITDLLRKDRENKPLPNEPGGGWIRSDIHELLNHTMNHETIGSFDVVVFRIPHGWITLNNITEPALNESVVLANELFGAKNVIFLSLPFVNNIMTMDDLEELHETNKMLKTFAQKNHSAVDNVMVLDFGRLGDALTEWNGKLMGFNVTNHTDYLFQRLNCCPKQGFLQTIAQVCTKRVRHGRKRCGPGNGFSVDGLHWCSENLNGRINAGTACLIQCMYSSDDVRECEKDCNNRFMSLRPIDEFVDDSLATSVS